MNEGRPPVLLTGATGYVGARLLAAVYVRSPEEGGTGRQGWRSAGGCATRRPGWKLLPGPGQAYRSQGKVAG